jgi:hypothetical protein
MKKNNINEKTGMVITRIYSVFNWIGAIACLLFAIIVIVFSSKLASMMPEIGMEFGSGLFIFLGIISFVIGLLGVAVAWGLWNFKNWARILTLVFVGLAFVSSLLGLFSDFNFWQILWLIFYAIIFYLFGFYKPIVHLFYDAFLAKKKSKEL